MFENNNDLMFVKIKEDDNQWSERRLSFDDDRVCFWTGRKDKEGTKIYTNDIVETGTGFVGIVRYNPKYWRFEVASPDESLDNIRDNGGIPEESWFVLNNRLNSIGKW